MWSWFRTALMIGPRNVLQSAIGFRGYPLSDRKNAGGGDKRLITSHQTRRGLIRKWCDAHAPVKHARHLNFRRRVRVESLTTFRLLNLLIRWLSEKSTGFSLIYITIRVICTVSNKYFIENTKKCTKPHGFVRDFYRVDFDLRSLLPLFIILPVKE